MEVGLFFSDYKSNPSFWLNMTNYIDVFNCSFIQVFTKMTVKVSEVWSHKEKKEKKVRTNKKLQEHFRRLNMVDWHVTDLRKPKAKPWSNQMGIQIQ